MLISDEGILVSKFKYGESSLIISVLTKNYGLQKGILKGGNNSKNRSSLEIGNILSVEKKARLEDHLGSFKIELKESYLQKIFFLKNNLLALCSICDLIHNMVVEKEVDTNFYNTTKSTIVLLQQDDFINHYIRWELLLLSKIGFGMDLSKCVVTNTSDGLYYISPKTGKAVCKEVGLPYADKLFTIPAIFSNNTITEFIIEDVLNAFKIVSHFLNLYAVEYNKQLPFQRTSLIASISNSNI